MRVTQIVSWSFSMFVRSFLRQTFWFVLFLLTFGISAFAQNFDGSQVIIGDQTPSTTFKFAGGKIQMIVENEVRGQGPYNGSGSLNASAPSVCDGRVIAKIPFKRVMTNVTRPKSFKTIYSAKTKFRNGCGGGIISNNVMQTFSIDMSKGCSYKMVVRIRRSGDRISEEVASNNSVKFGKCSASGVIVH